jgi:hypothetical protein
MITKDLQLKTIAVCSDLILEAIDDGQPLNENGILLKELLERQLEAVYSHDVVRDSKSYQETKNRVLYNINAHFKI